MRSFTDVVWAGMKYLISKNMSNPDIDWHVWSSPASKEEKHSSQWSYVEDINPQELTKIQQKQFHGIKCVAGCLCIPVKDKNFQITQQECRNIPGEQQVVENQLPSICEGYSIKDIYNCDDTSIFIWPLSQEVLCDKKWLNLLKRMLYCPAHMQCLRQEGEAAACR